LNTKLIAKRLIGIESEFPGRVKIRPNPLLRDGVTNKFKKMGFRKRLFQSPEQFNIDCFLGYVPAAESILHRVLFDGRRDEHGRIHCWDGVGRYMGWQGLGQLSNWLSPQIRDCVFLVYLDPFYDQISDLLEPIKAPL
jgi:hypothetical protein